MSTDMFKFVEDVTLIFPYISIAVIKKGEISGSFMEKITYDVILICNRKIQMLHHIMVTLMFLVTDLYPGNFHILKQY